VFVRRALQMLEGGSFEPSELTLPRLVSLLRFGEPIPVTEKAGMLVAVAVRPGSALDGVTVAESIGRMEGATAVAVLREEEMSIARGPTRIEAGDQVIAIARRPSYEILRRAAGEP
jgi:Trk K+ transport system NAD-binding subunit